MRRRRRYADLEPPLRELYESTEADAPPPARVADALDPAHAGLLALQRGAGNAAAERLLARDGPPIQVTQPNVLDPNLAVHMEAQKRTEERMLRDELVPALLTRLWQPPRIGPKESLAEIVLAARTDLDARLAAMPKLPGGPNLSAPALSPVATIQRIVLDVARARGAVIAGHRDPADNAGLQAEAQAIASLAGVALPQGLKAEGTSDGLKFSFDGELSVAGQLGPASVTGKIGAEGAKVEGEAGPVKGSVSGSGEAIKADVALKAGPVELKGGIDAKSGQATKWNAALELKIGGGAEAMPDPAKLTEVVNTAERQLVDGARYVASVVANPKTFDKGQLEARLKPIKDGAEAVAGVMKVKPQTGTGGPKVTAGVSVQGDGDKVTATLNLTITFP